jgi:hypothetical protein
MKPPSHQRKPLSPKKQLKRHLSRRLKPMVEKSRVLKFGIKGLTLVRDEIERAGGIRRWVTASALRITQRGPRA